jgi:hypothetical protein
VRGRLGGGYEIPQGSGGDRDRHCRAVSDIAFHRFDRVMRLCGVVVGTVPRRWGGGGGARPGTSDMVRAGVRVVTTGRGNHHRTASQAAGRASPSGAITGAIYARRGHPRSSSCRYPTRPFGPGEVAIEGAAGTVRVVLRIDV